MVGASNPPRIANSVLFPEPDGPTLAMLRLAPRVDVEEGFYGLGELFDRPEHRGATIVVLLADNGKDYLSIDGLFSATRSDTP